MPKNIYLDNNGGNFIATLAEDGKLLEYYMEKNSNPNIVGNIYKGKVITVLGGMQAAFVNVGLKKNAYLSVGELAPDGADLKEGEEIPSVLDIKEGDEILVQVVKDYIGNKGVKCSPYLSFAGVYLVYMPCFHIASVSRRITDEAARERLGKWARELVDIYDGSFIVRTAGEKIGKREIRKEAESLRQKYLEVMKAAENADAPALCYESGDLITRMLRDVYSDDVKNIFFGSRELYEIMLARKGKRNDEYVRKSVLFDKNTDMFAYFGLDEEVDKLLRNRVSLDNGAYLIIDKTEALTVIDVNTGKYTGENNLEDTVFTTNVFAAKEIARQVRLRNIGGIVVVDFIDMSEQAHRDKVVEVLAEALKDDRSKCNVLGMSALGLVEFTRKKKREECTSMLEQVCPYCKGDGKVFSDDYIVLKVRTALLDIFAKGYSAAVIDVNEQIAGYIFASGALSSDVKKIWTNKRIYIVPHKTYHIEFFRIRGDNSKVLELPDRAKLLF